MLELERIKFFLADSRGFFDILDEISLRIPIWLLRFVASSRRAPMSILHLVRSTRTSDLRENRDKTQNSGAIGKIE